MTADSRDEWVARVLGVSPASDGVTRAAGPAAWAHAIALSRSEAAKLKDALASLVASPEEAAALDERWKEIEQALATIDDLIAPVIDSATSLKAVDTAVEGARNVILSSPLLRTIDLNTVRPVAVTGRLVAAMDKLSASGGRAG